MTPTLVPVSQLRPSPHNPRKTPMSEAEIEAMASSIATIGQLYPLIVVKGCDEMFDVVGGGRRLTGLQRLNSTVKGEAVAASVLVYDSIDAAVEAAIAENEARAQMHACDKALAYQKQLDDGVPVSRIAAAFACSEAEVRRIVALASLPRVIFDACHHGKLSVDQARAFTVALTHEDAEALFERMPSWWGPREIRSELRRHDKTYDARNALAYVGEDAYLEAGGTITEDLFGDERFIDDPDLAIELGKAKLIATGAAIVEMEGWQWSGTEIPADFARCYPDIEHPDLPEGDTGRYDELAMKGEINDLTDAEMDEFNALCSRMDPIEHWSDDAKSVCGVVVMLGYGGQERIERGVIRAEDKERAAELGLIRLRSGSDTGSGPAPVDDPMALSDKLCMDLDGVLTLCLQKALMQKPQLALAVLATAAVNPTANPTAHVFRPGDVNEAHSFDDDGRRMVSGPLGMDLLADPELAGMTLDDFAKDKKAVNKALAHAASVGLSRLEKRRFEPLMEALGFKLRDWWKPDLAFFSRLKAGQLVHLWTDLTGADWPSMKKSKADKAQLLADLFDDPRGTTEKQGVKLPADMIQRIHAWVPQRLLFGMPEPVDDVRDMEIEDAEAA